MDDEVRPALMHTFKINRMFLKGWLSFFEEWLYEVQMALKSNICSIQLSIQPHRVIQEIHSHEQTQTGIKFSVPITQSNTPMKCMLLYIFKTRFQLVKQFNRLTNSTQHSPFKVEKVHLWVILIVKVCFTSAKCSHSSQKLVVVVQ